MMPARLDSQRGVTLVELLITLIVLSVGLLAVSQLFPSGTRNQERDTMLTESIHFAQEKVEQLQSKVWSDSALTVGRHPAGTDVETLAGTSCQRWYQVDAMAAPLDNLKKITVTVQYQGAGQPARTVSTVTYIRR